MREQVRPRGGAEERSSGRFSHAFADGHGGKRQSPQIDQIGHGVDGDDGQRPEDQAPRQIAARVSHLAGRERETVPAIIGPEHGDHRDAKASEKSLRERRRPLGKDRCGHEETDARQRHERSDLHHRDDVLNQGALADAEDVDNGQHRDGEEPRQLSARHRPGPSRQRRGKENVAG